MFKVIIDKYAFIAILNLVFQLILCFSFVPFFFFRLDDFLLFYACVCFLVFVNVFFGFDLWLPCFSSMFTSSYICVLWTDCHIGSNTFLKKASVFSYFPFSPFMILIPFFTSSCLSFCYSLYLSSHSQIWFIFPYRSMYWFI